MKLCKKCNMWSGYTLHHSDTCKQLGIQEYHHFKCNSCGELDGAEVCKCN